jgi:hypothetical protein
VFGVPASAPAAEAAPAPEPAAEPAPEPAPATQPAAPAPAAADDIFGSPTAVPVAPAPAAPQPAPAKPADDDPFSARVTPTEELLAMRSWTDNTGTFSVNGKLIAILDGKVRLLKENGRTCTVPMRRLSQADAEYVQVMAGKLGQGILIQLASR